MRDGELSRWASDIAARMMRPLGRRWQHVEQVGELARAVAPVFGSDGDVLVSAAMLHDVGYAPMLAITGFHPLDGARFVRRQGHERLALLVAHHSGARHEAKLRGVEDYETEFPFLDSDLDRALTYCDLTTGPDGTRVTLEQRVREITTRYGPDHTVSQAINASVPEFEEARVEMERRMAAAGITLTGSLALPR